jgi:hypothetical protein
MADKPLLLKNPTPVRLRPDQLEFLEKTAKELDRDVSWLIRKAIDGFKEAEKKKK